MFFTVDVAFVVVGTKERLITNKTLSFFVCSLEVVLRPFSCAFLLEFFGPPTLRLSQNQLLFTVLFDTLRVERVSLRRTDFVIDRWDDNGNTRIVVVGGGLVAV